MIKYFGSILLSLFSILILPNLFAEGMFLDGLIYASISRNIAENFSGLWDLHYTQSLDDQFYGHLPLGIWLQAILFKLFGDFLWVERVYGLIVIAMTAFMTIRISKIIFPEQKHLGMIVFALWLCFPVVTWSLSNNMLENTVQLFILFTLHFYVRILWQDLNIYWAIFSGILLACAILSKGPAAIFVIIFPLVYIVIYKKNIKAAILLFAINLGSLVTIFYFLWSNPESQFYLSQYFDKQLKPSFTSGDSVFYNFKILKCLIQNLVIPMGIVMLSKVFLTRALSFNKESIRPSLLFIILGLSGSIPILLSQKQSCAYIMPSLIFFSFAFALPLHSAIAERGYSIKAIFLKLSYAILILCIFVGAFGIFSFGKRDTALIVKVNDLNFTKDQTTITTSSREECDDWLYRAYLQRLRKLSLDCKYEQ